MPRTRRDVLKLSAGTLAIASAAGCIGDGNGGGAPDVGDEGGDDASAMASFYTMSDFTQNVGGEGFDVENAVPTGQHGHGWEPQADITPDVAERDALVYLGIEGFQSWADDVVTRMEEENHDVMTISATEGIDLLDYDDGGHDDHDGHDAHDEDHGDDDHNGEDDDDDHGDDHDDHDDHDDDHKDDDHDHGDYDPHAWLDPERAQGMVENIRDGLMDLDPDNEETYEENAGAYLEELQALDERFEEGLSDRERETVVIAGHDSFQYVSERYGFEIHTPQGVSPDSEASPNEIAETIDIVEEEGIDYILYDYFDGDTLAQTIANETDAEETIMISPAENLTEEWEAEGLDYLGQMEEINLPAFRQALGAE